jgi:hypothetical protein
LPPQPPGCVCNPITGVLDCTHYGSGDAAAGGHGG